MQIKQLLRIIALVVTIAVMFYVYLPAYSYAGKNSFGNILSTLGSPNHIDVACIGSSHVFTGINPVQLYEEYGITSYDLASGGIAPVQEYYYLLQTNKHKDLKMALVDVYTFINADYYADNRTVSALINYPFGINKMKAVFSSACDNPWDIIFVFPYTHNEYHYDLHFYKKKGEYNEKLGYSLRIGIEQLSKNDLYDASNEKGIKEIPEDAELYLRKIIEYCEKHNIELLLTNTPWPLVDSESQKKFNYIQTVADEYGVNFLNGCLYTDEIGLDYLVDNGGDGGHLNFGGVTKYTTWLGKYLIDNYQLEDRRGDTAYLDYDKAVQVYHELHDEEIAEYYAEVGRIYAEAQK